MVHPNDTLTRCARCGREGIYYADPLDIGLNEDGGVHDHSGNLILGAGTGDVVCTPCHAGA